MVTGVAEARFDRRCNDGISSAGASGLPVTTDQDVAAAIRSKRMIEVLARLVSLHGASLFLRSGNEPKFVSRAILESISGTGIATVLHDPGKPWQNGTDESFNGKFRDECLFIEWFARAAKPLS